MNTYNFTLILDGPNVLDDEGALDRLYDNGSDDASIGQRAMGSNYEESPVQIAEFDREDETFSSAVISAIRDVERAGVGLTVHRVEPDDLVTASVIADRTDRTRESVRLLISGDRGPGGFPAPLAWVDAKTRLWRWSDVERWFAERLGETPTLGGAAQFIGILNAMLEARTQMTALSEIAAISREQSAHFEVSGEDLQEPQELIGESAAAPPPANRCHQASGQPPRHDATPTATAR